jgi:uncharacterized protein DUF6941
VEPALGQSVSIDFALLADAVAVSGDRVHVLGGGWDTLRTHSVPATVHSVSVAMRLRVPWTKANERFLVHLDLEDEDGLSILGEHTVSQPFELGRPSGLPPGSDLGLLWSYTFTHVELPKAGTYSFVIGIDDAMVHRIRFRVVAAHAH